ncbi:MAG TPA: tetratricopeptide repeat protein [Moraxellaceae bacterium]
MRRPLLHSLPLLVLLALLPACASQPAGEPEPAQKACATRGLSSEQELSLSLVQQREKDGQLYAALAELQSLPESSPEVLRHKADILRRLGRPEAKSYFQRLQKTCMSAWADHGLALIAADAGDIATAQKLLQRAAQSLPTEYRLRNDLGVLLLREQKIDEARFELMTALELASDSSLPAVNLLTLLMVQQKTPAMRSLMQRYKMSASEWQAAVQSCEDLVAFWGRQGTPSAPSRQLCTVPAPVSFPVAVGRKGETS